MLEQALVEAVHLQARPPPAPAPAAQLARPASSPAAPRRRQVRVPAPRDMKYPVYQVSAPRVSAHAALHCL